MLLRIQLVLILLTLSIPAYPATKIVKTGGDGGSFAGALAGTFFGALAGSVAGSVGEAAAKIGADAAADAAESAASAAERAAAAAEKEAAAAAAAAEAAAADAAADAAEAAAATCHAHPHTVIMGSDGGNGFCQTNEAYTSGWLAHFGEATVPLNNCIYSTTSKDCSAEDAAAQAARDKANAAAAKAALAAARAAAARAAAQAARATATGLRKLSDAMGASNGRDAATGVDGVNGNDDYVGRNGSKGSSGSDEPPPPPPCQPGDTRPECFKYKQRDPSTSSSSSNSGSDPNNPTNTNCPICCDSADPLYGGSAEQIDALRKEMEGDRARAEIALANISQFFNNQKVGFDNGVVDGDAKAKKLLCGNEFCGYSYCTTHPESNDCTIYKDAEFHEFSDYATLSTATPQCTAFSLDFGILGVHATDIHCQILTAVKTKVQAAFAFLILFSSVLIVLRA